MNPQTPGSLSPPAAPDSTTTAPLPDAVVERPEIPAVDALATTLLVLVFAIVALIGTAVAHIRKHALNPDPDALLLDGFDHDPSPDPPSQPPANDDANDPDPPPPWGRPGDWWKA